KFGTGPIRREEVTPPAGAGGEEEEGGPPEKPDAYEVRLLLAQDFGERVEWALNGFFEQEIQGDRGREWGFAQSAVTPILLPNERLKVGIEMQYKNFTMAATRDDPVHSFVIGPTIAWKASRCTQIYERPLFSVTDAA